MLQRLYNEGKKAGIPADLWNSELSEFQKAIEEGSGVSFDKVEFNTPDWEMVQNLRYNTAVYDAFKLNAQRKDLWKLLTDENGNKRSFKDFKAEAEKVTNQYNKVWLQTEYNQAHQSANQARRWNDAVKTKDLYPNLKYVAVMDERTRSSHAQLNGAIYPIDSAFWNSNYPPNGYGCRCTARPTDEPEDKKPGLMFDEKSPFNTNVGKTSKIFTDQHPLIKEGNRKEVMAFLEGRIKTVPEILASFKKFEKYDGNWKKELFDGNTGGYTVWHNNHEFDPTTGPREQLTSKILAENGYQIPLLPKIYGQKNPDTDFLGMLSEIKVMSGPRNMLNRAKTAVGQGASRIIFYIDFNNTKEMFINLNSISKIYPQLKEIWYVLDDELKIYK